MSENSALKVGDRVEHVDAPGSAGIVQRFPYHPFAVVRWESTGRESTENVAYLQHADS